MHDGLYKLHPIAFAQPQTFDDQPCAFRTCANVTGDVGRVDKRMGLQTNHKSVTRKVDGKFS